MNFNLSTKNSTMLRKRIFTNKRILKKRRNWSKKNSELGKNSTTMTMMIMKNMKMRRNSGTIYLTGSSLQILCCP